MSVETQWRVTKLQEMVYELTVGKVMTREPITVDPRSHVRDLRELLRVNRISGFPVMDDDNLVGIISIEDFIKCLADGQNSCTVEEKMTRRVETLYDDDPLAVAIGRFEASGLGRFPVVDREHGTLVGIVTKGDLIEGLLKRLDVNHYKEEIRRHRASYIFEDIEADGTTLQFEYDIKGQDFKAAGEGSSRLKRTLLRLGLRPEIARRVAIASYEAEMNLVIFTDGGIIGVSVQPSQVLVEVRDQGPGIPDVEQALQPGYSTALDWVREMGFGAGMGLPNIQSMSDSFHLESRVGEGTTLEILFKTDEVQHEAE